MEAGDEIALINPVTAYTDQTRIRGRILEVEKYRGAFILRWRSHRSGGEAILVCFPEYQYLPPIMGIENPVYYAAQAFVEWEGHIWPVAVGKHGSTHLLPDQLDPRAFARARVDHVLHLVEHAHMTSDITITPNDERTERDWRKWLPHF